MVTNVEKIRNKIKRAPKGTLFILADFSHLNIPYNTLKDTIRKFVKKRELIKVFQGIYKKPNFNKLLQREVPASPHEIAVAYARKNGWKIIPSRDIALNRLGLTTQVPNAYEYKSSGPTRSIVLNNDQIVKFKAGLAREIDIDSTSALVIEAFKALGENNVTKNDLKTIKSKLSGKQLKQLKKDSTLSRIWIKDLIIRMEKM
ncbi:hypothetical protein IW492_03365 [Enterococcus sp. BWB1-3]|uniref:DUF6088 family protein n=1 Tax=Enterococcus sp. BWB1-3 TaxID=2787713 RepID=UPI0019235E67|nr:DUF6088 family protein [Enterococcus sp. BWB1-3]MBL1228272.1 hypothetical protein [Enterococcus sp. BWB1-3]